ADATLAATSTIDSNGLDAIWHGVLSGAGGLVKDGDGVLSLTGANTYTGETAIRQGTLIVGIDAAGSISSDVSVQSGATLGGGGSIGGSVSVAEGASLSPGNGIGTLTIAGDLDLAADSLLDFGVGALCTDFQFTGHGHSAYGDDHLLCSENC